MTAAKNDTTLVIGDAHVDPRQAESKTGLNRFKWAREYIRATTPSRVVIIGDWWTLDSVSSYDRKGSLTKENARYQRDIDAGSIALRMLDVPKNIPVIFVEGNHEVRAAKFIEEDPVLQGALVTPREAVLKLYPKAVWVPYKDFWYHRGVGFTHVPINEGGKPIGGKYATTKALDICNTSVVFGHTHRLDVASVHRHGASHLNQSVNVGCFFEHVDAYARGSVTSYWRGLVTLTHYDVGRIDIETISLGRLRREYGGA